MSFYVKICVSFFQKSECLLYNNFDKGRYRQMKNYYITDDVTLSDAIDYVEEIYEPEIIEPYIDHIDITSESK